eukprot:8248853-Karenia_brevis.AAC.1
MVKYMRRLILLAASAVKKRLHYFRQKPWIYFGVGDTRMQIHERRQLAEDLHSSYNCCVPFGFGQLMKARTSVDTWTLNLSIVSLEDLHARNRRNAHAQMSWQCFAA